MAQRRDDRERTWERYDEQDERYGSRGGSARGDYEQTGADPGRGEYGARGGYEPGRGYGGPRRGGYAERDYGRRYERGYNEPGRDLRGGPNAGRYGEPGYDREWQGRGEQYGRWDEVERGRNRAGNYESRNWSGGPGRYASDNRADWGRDQPQQWEQRSGQERGGQGGEYSTPNRHDGWQGGEYGGERRLGAEQGGGAFGSYGDYNRPLRGTGNAESQWGRSQFEGGAYAGCGPKGYHRSDERIKEDVCEQLTQNGQVDASNIEVEVKNGEVTLSGTVEQRNWKRLAEDTLEGIAGVKDIHNQLRTAHGHNGAEVSSNTPSRTAQGQNTTGQSAEKSARR